MTNTHTIPLCASLQPRRRKIAAFTATRAEYGLLRPVLFQLEQSPSCHLDLVVSGTHLSDTHGYTVNEIRNDGFTPSASIPADLQSDSPVALAASLGRMIADISQALEVIQPDIFLLLGDRYECMGAATAATLLHIPVAHVHGGEITQGAMDDVFRHAITKMAHLHFTSCEAYRQRVIQLGEQPDRVWNVGALGVENARTVELLPEAHLRADVNIPDGAPYFLCTFHPVTLEVGEEAKQLQELLSAFEAFPTHHILFTGANADQGGNTINRMLHEYAAVNTERVRVRASLGVTRYLSAAKYAVCVVGNSSSGVVELPSIGTPVVDIGNRQQGRLRAEAVIHCQCFCEAIIRALATALTPVHQSLAQQCPNPYEGENTSQRIAHILQINPLPGIIHKVFYNVQGTPA